MNYPGWESVRNMSVSETISEARRVLEIEYRWLKELIPLLDESFDSAVDLLSEVDGKIIVCGIGKSGHVARKISATMTSTGNRAYFLHPTEGIHGDLGILSRGDAVLILSKSGETEEVAALLPSIKRLEIPIIAILTNPGSLLGRASDVNLLLPDLPEACPHNLVPTASTTAMMALGDALAIAMLRRKGFSPEDFAEVHPGGSLGRKLLMRVSDLMIDHLQLPEVPSDAILAEAIRVMTEHRGVCFTTEQNGQLAGIFVYGDLGRLMKERVDIFSIKLQDVLVKNPVTAYSHELASVALARMEKPGITNLIVVDDEKKPVGVIYLHDIMRAGIH